LERVFILFLSTCKCGKHYLGSSTRKNKVGRTYFGSGNAWSEHLETCEVASCETLHETCDQFLHKKKAKELSEHYDVVKNENFFNIITESGGGVKQNDTDVSTYNLETLIESQDKELPLLNLIQIDKFNNEKEEYDEIEMIEKRDTIEKFWKILSPREVASIKNEYNMDFIPVDESVNTKRALRKLIDKTSTTPWKYWNEGMRGKELCPL